jgi:chemotaxis protein CheD
MELHVKVGDCIITQNPSDILKTFALGTCVGVTAHSQRNRLAGMLHIMLPRCPDDASKILRPYSYADTGFPLFLENLLQTHCLKSDLSFQVYGGASSIAREDYFQIGARNLIEIEDLLVYHKLYYKMMDVAGNVSRTITMDAFTGFVIVNSQIF